MSVPVGVPTASASESRTSLCQHCGDPCGAGSVFSDAGTFCCVGCESVFAALHESGLADYYACPVPPGVAQRDADPRDAARFAAIDRCWSARWPTEAVAAMA